MHKILTILIIVIIPFRTYAQLYSDNNKDFNAPIEKAKLKHIFNPICKQASFISKKHLICLSNDGHAIAYPLFSTQDSTLFDMDCVKYMPHCNVANTRQFKGEDYVYISEWNNEKRFFVEHIKYDKPKNLWSTRLVQIINMDIPQDISGAGYTDWIIDSKNNKLYAHTYLDNVDKNDKYGHGVVILEFNLPSPLAGNITLKQKDIIRRAVYPMIYVTQDKEINNGKLLILAGLRTNKKENWDFSRKLTVIDLKTLKVEKLIDLSFYFDEPEGIDIYKGKTLITFRRGTFELKSKY